MAINGGRKGRKGHRGGLIAALDIGSSKVCCFIARADDSGSARVIGIGHQSSHGVRAGAIVDMEAAEAAIGNAVHTAEQMAGETIHSLMVNVSGGQPTSRTVSVEVAVSEPEVSDGDLRRAMAHTRAQYQGGDNELLHAIPVNYSLDGSRGIRDPRGMAGDRLGVQMHLVTAGGGPVRNLTTCISRCHLDIDSLVVSPYAAALACLVEDEMDLGVTCIDLGGGTTTLSVFLERNLVHTDSLPVGGAHVTNDIARGLTTPVVHAERMKILHGHARVTTADEREMIDVPQVGEDERGHGNRVPKSLLVGIIQPRLEEIFELTRSRLEHSGFGKVAGRRVVLTGGASQLPGIRELAQEVLDKQVRLGRPARIGGLAEATGGPAFSVAAGLLLHAVRRPAEMALRMPLMPPPAGLFGRVGTWLRENL